MRILLLLSALLTALAAIGAPARAGGVSAQQVGVLVAVAEKRDAAVVAEGRPGFARPSLRDVAAPPVPSGMTRVAKAAPLYVNRLRV